MKKDDPRLKVGTTVYYGSKHEKGTVTSWNDSYVFVKFNKEAENGIACRYYDVYFHSKLQSDSGSFRNLIGRVAGAENLIHCLLEMLKKIKYPLTPEEEETLKQTAKIFKGVVMSRKLLWQLYKQTVHGILPKIKLIDPPGDIRYVISPTFDINPKEFTAIVDYESMVRISAVLQRRVEKNKEVQESFDKKLNELKPRKRLYLAKNILKVQGVSVDMLDYVGKNGWTYFRDRWVTGYDKLFEDEEGNEYIALQHAEDEIMVQNDGTYSYSSHLNYEPPFAPPGNGPDTITVKVSSVQFDRSIPHSVDYLYIKNQNYV